MALARDIAPMQNQLPYRFFCFCMSDRAVLPSRGLFDVSLATIV